MTDSTFKHSAASQSANKIALYVAFAIAGSLIALWYGGAFAGLLKAGSGPS